MIMSVSSCLDNSKLFATFSICIKDQCITVQQSCGNTCITAPSLILEQNLARDNHLYEQTPKYCQYSLFKMYFTYSHALIKEDYLRFLLHFFVKHLSPT